MAGFDRDPVAPVWIVIPACNEAPQVGAVVRAVRERHPNVVVVDDGSTDGTGAEARAAGASVVRHGINCGQGAALQSGIDFALARGAAAVVTFDADGQHMAPDIDVLLDPLRRLECDVVLGSRFLLDDGAVPPGRRRLLRLAVAFTRLVSGIRVTDTHNGLRAFTRDAAARIEIVGDRMEHASELLDFVRRSGLRWREVPVRIRYTEYARGKGQRGTSALRILVTYLLGRLLP